MAGTPIKKNNIKHLERSEASNELKSLGKRMALTSSPFAVEYPVLTTTALA